MLLCRARLAFRRTYESPSMRRTFISLVVFLAMCGAAIAADMPTKAPPIELAPAIPGWTFSLTPYAWAISLNGPVTVKGRTTDVDANFFQILDHTQFPKGLLESAALGEARYDRFALLTDIAYFKLGLGASITRSRANRCDWCSGWSVGWIDHRDGHRRGGCSV